MATAEMHQIGEVAERVGLSLRTIRYYEEEGLVVPSRRTEGGFRLYSEEDIERLALVKQMKPLGFSIQEMLGLLSARDALASGSEGKRDALEQLAGFAERAKEKCGELRERLATAEDFAAQLRAEHRRYGRRQR